MKVTLRKRKLKTGQTTLYLDIYNNNKREYEYLNLYLHSPKSPLDRKTNKKTIELAENLRAERQLYLQNRTNGVKNTERGKSNLHFFNFC